MTVLEEMGVYIIQLPGPRGFYFKIGKGDKERAVAGQAYWHEKLTIHSYKERRRAV